MKIKQDPPEEIASVQDLISRDDKEILEGSFVEAINFIADRYGKKISK